MLHKNISDKRKSHSMSREIVQYTLRHYLLYRSNQKKHNREYVTNSFAAAQ